MHSFVRRLCYGLEYPPIQVQPGAVTVGVEHTYVLRMAYDCRESGMRGNVSTSPLVTHSEGA